MKLLFQPGMFIFCYGRKIVIRQYVEQFLSKFTNNVNPRCRDEEIRLAHHTLGALQQSCGANLKNNNEWSYFKSILNNHGVVLKVPNEVAQLRADFFQMANDKGVPLHELIEANNFTVSFIRDYLVVKDRCNIKRYIRRAKIKAGFDYCKGVWKKLKELKPKKKIVPAPTPKPEPIKPKPYLTKEEADELKAFCPNDAEMNKIIDELSKPPTP